MLLCYRIFAPFLVLMVWALILAVALYPLQQMLSRRMGGRQGLAATLIVVIGLVVIVAPTAVLMGSLGDSIKDLVHGVQTNTLEIPAPRPGVEQWPLVGEKIYGAWVQAHTNLPQLIESMQPKVGDLAKGALGFVASIGVAILVFLAAFIVAGILMTYGESGARSAEAIFSTLAARSARPGSCKLATATIRAVAQGVIGVALIQAIVIGLALMVAGVPFAGALALVALVLGIAQLPALLVTLPVIIYIWSSGDYGTAAAVVYTVILGIGGILDNFLKPLMLGRGVDAPMPVILLGALGGMAAAGIHGLFVGAVLLTLGYQIFMGWVPQARTPGDAGSKDVRRPQSTDHRTVDRDAGGERYMRREPVGRPAGRCWCACSSRSSFAYWSMRYYVRTPTRPSVDGCFPCACRSLLGVDADRDAGHRGARWRSGGCCSSSSASSTSCTKSVYHSAVNFASLGYGDIVMSRPLEAAGSPRSAVRRADAGHECGSADGDPAADDQVAAALGLNRD